MKFWPFILALVAATSIVGATETVPTPAPASATGELRIAFRGLRNAQGQLAVLLFDRATGFPGHHRQARERRFVALRDAADKPIPEEQLLAVFSNLPPGDYAVSVLHDEDGDRRMRTGPFGIPREGIGASNNPAMRFGPPKFDDARFTFDGNSATLSITVRYF